MKQFFSLTVLTGLMLALLPTPPLYAQELEGIGSISFQQIAPEEDPDVIGTWTLVRPGNIRTEGDEKNFNFEELEAGMYTFSTVLPQGTSAVIELLLNGQLVESVERPQISIPLDGLDRYLIKITYTYSRTGLVAVNSSPGGLTFTLKGPNETVHVGQTPASFTGPEGQWTAYFEQIEGCPKIPAQSDKLVKDSRITLSVSIICDNLKDSDIGKQQEKSLEFVTVTVDGRNVIFEDVHTEDWFAPYVYTVAKTGIISGYKDESGNPKGIFGPSENVTIAQLSKIAHELSGLDETKIRVPVINTKAKNTWFEQYFASAEQLWWEVWRDRRINPARPAKRDEVIATILRALNVRRVWAEGKTFSDVKPTDKYASAIETAAADGLIDIGEKFRSDDPINRAEMAKIIARAIDLYIEDTSESRGKVSQ
ncbi:MAG: S-layer homology domain-containing protein [bacterium]|nr:S-layer homology domain-containing protein [bacterium]MDA1292273.1 S-layer homology domain-containing protein [bacterium]